jgi:hypothetical protein
MPSIRESLETARHRKAIAAILRKCVAARIGKINGLFSLRERYSKLRE